MIFFQVHVWAAISRRGASNVAIFDGLMDRFSFVSIQQQFLKPFAEETFPDGYRLIQVMYILPGYK